MGQLLLRFAKHSKNCGDQSQKQCKALPQTKINETQDASPSKRSVKVGQTKKLKLRKSG